MNPDMNPPDPIQPPQPGIPNPLSVAQPGERIVCEIKRHPIGLLGVYAICGALLLALAVLCFVVAPSAFTDSRGQAMAISSVIFFVVGIILLVFVFIANKVYWGNRWVVTSDSITQINRVSLFNKQSSQLSLGHLEDITAAQNGVLQQLFKYGTLKAETAGESSKFTFLYCPNPNYYAQKILAAREAFEQVYHGGRQDPGQPAPAPQPAPQQQSVPQQVTEQPAPQQPLQ